MIIPRVVPLLLLQGSQLVKTTKFKNPTYVGDPVNAVRIFNEKEVDELIFVDIAASREGRAPSLEVLEDIASECFMPLAYGGGVSRIEHIRDIQSLGVEKIVLNSHVVSNPEFITEAADYSGSQSIVVSIDAKRTLSGGYRVYSHGGTKKSVWSALDFAKEAENRGAGEIVITAIDRDGSMSGYDLDLIGLVSGAVNIPVVASGGAANVEDFVSSISVGASAAAAGAMFVFHGKHRAVLISFPARVDLEEALGNRES